VKHRFWVSVLAAFFLLSPIQASATSADGATKFINDLSNKALQVLSADGVDLAEKKRMSAHSCPIALILPSSAVS